MQTRSFGRHGPAVGIIGQGTWQLERASGDAAATLRRGVELGLNHVDTAEIYADGEVERLVGEALEPVREQVFLVSKIDPARATRRQAQLACEQSLKRLRTDHLDAYLLHWLPPHDLEEAVEAMQRLVERGMVRQWGVSNFDEFKIDEVVALAGAERVACNQVLYHPGERAIEHAVLPACQRHGITVVGYSPFAVGALPGAETEGGRTLREVASRHGASAHQVALAFLTRLPGTLTIPKASSVAHVQDNAAAASLELSREELAALDAAFPPGERRPGIPTW